jgi:hypothetical protein
MLTGFGVMVFNATFNNISVIGTNCFVQEKKPELKKHSFYKEYSEVKR